MMPRSSFCRNFVIVTVIHMALVSAIVFTAVRSCQRGSKDTVPDHLPIAMVVESSPTPPRPDPQPADLRQHSEPKGVPAPPKKRTPQKRRPRRTTARKRAPAKPVTEAEIRKALQIKPSPTPTPRNTDQDIVHLEMVKDAFRKAWVQPSDEVGNATAIALVRLDQNGMITSHRISRMSGNRALDASVARALAAVKQVHGLPKSFVQTHEVIEMTFKVEGR